MGKYLKLFETHSQYTAFTQTEDFILPNVSYCKDQTDIVHYNPIVPPQETRLMVTYMVEDANSPTPLYFYNTDAQAIGADMFDKVEIDGTEVSVADLDTDNGSYQLGIGEHTVAYTLKDPTIIGVVQIDESTFKVNAVFMQCNAITNVTIPNSVTTIGMSAFNGCTSLASVNIPSSVTSIGEEAFAECQSLTRVEIDSNTIMSTYTYEDNLKNAFGTQVTEYVIGNSVTSIGAHAFNLCSSLTSVTIPNSVTSIDGYAFGNCSSLTSVNIGDGVTSIADYAFCGCILDNASKTAINAINTNATICESGPQ